MRWEEIRINPEFTQLLTSSFGQDLPSGSSDLDLLKADSVPEIRKKLLFTDDYLKKIIFKRKEYDVQNQMLPPNCRYLEKFKDGHIVIIEEPPAFRTVFLDLDLTWEKDVLREKGKVEEYGYANFDGMVRPHAINLAFPYIIYFYFIDNNYMVKCGSLFFRTKQATGLSDPLFKANLFNIGSGQAICFGGNLNKNRPLSLTAAIQDALKVYWTTVFNTDYSYNYREYNQVPLISTYLEWQYHSQTNPMFIYSAEWLPYDVTIEKHLDWYRKSFTSGKDFRDMTFDDLYNIATKPTDSGVEKIKKTTRKVIKQKIYYDITNSIAVNGIDMLYVGDYFLSRSGREIYIMSYGGVSDGSDITQMIVSIDGKRSVIKINKKVMEFICKQVKDQKYLPSFKLENGFELLPNRIIVNQNAFGEKVYKKLMYLRKCADGQIEARIGSEYILVSNLKQDYIEFFDEDNIKFYNSIIKKDQNYLIASEFQTTDSYMVSGTIGKYNELHATPQGKMTLIFRENYKNFKDARETVKVALEERANKSTPIISVEECRELRSPYLSGKKIMYLKNSYNSKTEENTWATSSGVIQSKYATHIPLKNENFKSMIANNKFTLDSCQIPIEFNIGDKVIAVDWKNPISVLTVKTLTAFVLEEKDNKIYFILQDKNGNLAKEEYVSGSSKIVNSSKIRKVTNKYNELSTGMKIMAKETSISMFPKKDVNIIVAFIIDSIPEPLVLCSNGMTLWYSEVMDKFQIIKMTSKKWEKLPHVPLDPSKIKFQCGDIINCVGRYYNNTGYYIYYDKSKYATHLAQPIEYYTGYPETYTFSRMSKEAYLDCIPMPRVAQDNPADLFTGFIDLYTGTVRPNHRSKFQFIKQHPGQNIVAGQAVTRSTSV
jgi:hypothetical protein